MLFWCPSPCSSLVLCLEDGADEHWEEARQMKQKQQRENSKVYIQRRRTFPRLAAGKRKGELRDGCILRLSRALRNLCTKQLQCRKCMQCMQWKSLRLDSLRNHGLKVWSIYPNMTANNMLRLYFIGLGLFWRYLVVILAVCEANVTLPVLISTLIQNHQWWPGKARLACF